LVLGETDSPSATSGLWESIFTYWMLWNRY